MSYSVPTHTHSTPLYPQSQKQTPSHACLTVGHSLLQPSFSQHKEALSDPLVNRKPTSTISSVDVQSPAGTSWFYCLSLVIFISSLEVKVIVYLQNFHFWANYPFNFTSIYDRRMRSWSHFFVYFKHFFQYQYGKMSLKRVQGERWLSRTGTNMSKLQLKIRNKHSISKRWQRNNLF